jgi:hypothetical protein
MGDFENDPRRKQELRGRPIADRVYRYWLSSEHLGIERFNHKDDVILDRQYAIDVQLTLPGSRQILLGQEKFLSHNQEKYNSLTVEYHQNPQTEEPGDWFKLAPQFYMVGYYTKDGSNFGKVCIVNWAALVMETYKGNVNWQDNTNRDGYARASFRYVNFDDIPVSCLLFRFPPQL